MAKSFRKIDMKAEDALATFMDKNFYSKLHDKDGNHVSYERKTDISSQLNGIDVELIVGNRHFFIDEKASIYYSNAMIPTFAFEINSMQHGHEQPIDGWFINEDLKTNYYMLIWPNVKCELTDGKWIRKNPSEIQYSDFTIIEAMLIEKKDLVNEAIKHGCDKVHLIEYAIELREMMEISNERKDIKVDDYFKITYTGALNEKPINVVIQKSVLKKIAKATYLISEDGYAEI